MDMVDTLRRAISDPAASCMSVVLDGKRASSVKRLLCCFCLMRTDDVLKCCRAK